MYSIFAVLALLFLTINFFPYGIYLPVIEAGFSQASGRTVKVGAMRVDVYPKPGLFLNNVSIGTGSDEIHIDEIRLQPDISSLIEPKIIFQEAVLGGVPLSAEQIPNLPSFFVALARPGSGIGVKHVRFVNVDASFGSLAFPRMDGEVNLSASGLFQSVDLHSLDRTLNLELKPLAKRLDIRLDGLGWRPTQGSTILFDSFNVKGSIENDTFSISNLELHVFDGVIQGAAVLRANKMLNISGDLLFERINARRLGEALGIGSQFSGETAGKLKFSTIADSSAEIFAALSADGEFTMSRGGVRGIDLAEVVRRSSSAPVQGGETSFEQLAGKIKLTPTISRFSGLVLNSGRMQSTGTFEVGKDLTVNGRMELQMRGTVNQTRVPISISGPLNAPITQLGKGE
jgi:hypothetical protein